MDRDVLINKLRVIINHLPLMSSERQVLAISNANCMLDAYFLTNGKFIKTYARDCMPPNSKLNPKQATDCKSFNTCELTETSWCNKHCDLYTA